MKRTKRCALAALAVFSLAGAAHADWIESWGAAPVTPTAPGGPFPGSPSFENQTLRQVVRLSAGGGAIRVRISNEYGEAPLSIGAATVTPATEDGQPLGAPIPLTFSTQRDATVPPGAPLLSDPLELAVDELSSLSISLYLPEETGLCTCHSTGVQTGYISAPGDHTGEAFAPAETFQYRAYLTGVLVDADAPAKTIVTFGDSITDGMGATPDSNMRWPDQLAERLAARDGAAWGVSNAGISGNRLLADGAGQSILARMDRDVLAVPGVEYVVLFIGINDINFAFGGIFGEPETPLTAEAMIAGYRQVIARAHANGLKIYGATITPYNGVASYNAEGEAVRQAINAWMREGGEFDAVLDFDAAWRDPADPTRVTEGLHAGDYLHGSDAGYTAFVDAIDLSLFQ